jgi:HEAT repeat protein
MEQSTNYRQMVLDTITNALTNDPNPEVRAKAAESLGKLGEAAVTPLLLMLCQIQTRLSNAASSRH